MTVRIHSDDLAELLVEAQFPAEYRSSDEGGITERIYSAQMLGGKGTYREMFMENIHVGFGHLCMPNGMHVRFSTDLDSVEMHFLLRGDTLAEDSRSQEQFAFGTNQHNIMYASEFRGRAQYLPEQCIQVFEVNLLPDFFQRFLPRDHRSFMEFLAALNRKQTAVISPYNYPITPAMHCVIQEVIRDERKGVFKRMFIEAKVTELLLLQLEQIISQQPLKDRSLKPLEIDRMHAVKDYLLTHLNHPHTLSQLAQEFGTNEFALKKGFKAVFGTTVFGYWNAAKMEQARHWLLEENLTVGEVSDRVGYKNPQHFTTAFKRQFGYPPSRLR